MRERIKLKRKKLELGDADFRSKWLISSATTYSRNYRVIIFTIHPTFRNKTKLENKKQPKKKRENS